MMFSRAARRAGGTEASRLIANAPIVKTSAIGLGRKSTLKFMMSPLTRLNNHWSVRPNSKPQDPADDADSRRLGQDHLQCEPTAGSHRPQHTNFAASFEHRECQRVEKCDRGNEHDNDPYGVGDEHALMQRRLEACQRRATVVYVVRRRHHAANVCQQAVRISASGRGDLQCRRCRAVEPRPHLIEVHPDGADDRREVRHQGQHSRPLRAVRRLQPQLVADPDVEGLAQILREHHAPTGEHVVAYPFIERAVERIGGSGREPVEHHARAADVSECKRALGDMGYARHCGHLFGKTLRQSVGGIPVGQHRRSPKRRHPRPVRRCRAPTGSCRRSYR